MVASSTFYQLNYSNQADLLLQEGTFIQSRFEDKFIVDLYELHDLCRGFLPPGDRGVGFCHGLQYKRQIKNNQPGKYKTAVIYYVN